MRKKQTHSIDRLYVAAAIVAFIGFAILVIGQAKAEAADPRYPFLVERSAITHQVSARRHVERTRIVDANGTGTQIIGGRPAGCPHRYCGCGLARYLGLDDKRLNLAWNWAKLFPREHSPRPGLAAVRRGHVMYIEASVGSGQFLIRDYNSGGGLSRLHVRDVRGYVFVNPSARHAAMMR